MFRSSQGDSSQPDNGGLQLVTTCRWWDVTVLRWLSQLAPSDTRHSARMPLVAHACGSSDVCWTTCVSQPGVECLSCIDDRCFWCKDVDAALQNKSHSDEFDSAFGFTCSSHKCQLAYSPGAQGAQLGSLLAYSSGQTLVTFQEFQAMPMVMASSGKTSCPIFWRAPPPCSQLRSP